MLFYGYKNSVAGNQATESKKQKSTITKFVPFISTELTYNRVSSILRLWIRRWLHYFMIMQLVKKYLIHFHCNVISPFLECIQNTFQVYDK